MGKKVTRRKKEIANTEHGWRIIYDITVIKVVADSYSELVSGLDEISEDNLRWWNGNIESLGIEGMPRRTKGKWVATLRTLCSNRRHDDGRKLKREMLSHPVMKRENLENT